VKEQLKKAMAKATDAGGPPPQLALGYSDVTDQAGNGDKQPDAEGDAIDGGSAPLGLAAEMENAVKTEPGDITGSVDLDQPLDAGQCPGELTSGVAGMYQEDTDDDEDD